MLQKLYMLHSHVSHARRSQQEPPASTICLAAAGFLTSLTLMAFTQTRIVSTHPRAKKHL